LDAARALADALATSASARRAAEARTEALAAQLHEEGFADEAAAGLARLSPAEMQAGQAAIRAYDDDLAGARGVLAEADLAGLPENPIDLDPTRLALQAAGAARDDALARRESLRERATALTALVGDARARFALAADLLTTQAQVRQLAAVVHGDDPNTKRMKLETYVLAAQLEEIIAAANNRLRTMTGGRYALEHDDALQYRGSQAGLGLAIRDEHTGRARATHSLSGGETFLASLALALGLAEVVSNQAGGIALDTLFVDEGFGSLDAETLETAMSTLDSLRAGGRTIGLISHVESMKEQIPAKLAIRVTAQGYSEIIP
ncbi:SbcC/MukB-like Walker B domain-containing protein, partial [Cryobacterium zongtaii]|uniref:SbcC/MukB-like Walker B domain-containing protein n=4 Tax=Cryobacterium TaxID=69578 RepID=UPI000D48BD0B